VKEWSWAAHQSLPFQWILKLLMIHIVLNAVKMLNFFPTKGGISDTLSPKTIMSGETCSWLQETLEPPIMLDNTVRCMSKVPRAIVKVQQLRVPSCLDPVVTSKEDTSSWLWILLERKLITEAGMWLIPMPDTVITQVNALGTDQPKQLIFTN
jgi:hypothetical protein